MSYFFYIIISCISITHRVLALAPFPDISSAERTQFYDLKEDGSYTYGYDTGVGLEAKQSADASNQVEGQYVYKTPDGRQIDLKYTAGVQGFVPKGWAYVPETTTFHDPSSGGGFSEEPVETTTNFADAIDSSYSFGFKNNDQSRQKSADVSNNVQGSYTGGSLSQPNGLSNSNNNFQGSVSNQAAVPSNPADISNNLAYGSLNPDGSYLFRFKTNDQSRQESADASNNVHGSYSYQNSAGSHDLSYVSGAATGFKPTGGSLSQPNGLSNSNNNFQGSLSNQAAVPINSADTSNNLAYGSLNPDGSYSFGFKTNDQSRQESADARNNVQGSYSYHNSAGSHDLSYVAGAATGFKPTGGSLSQPNGLSNSNNNFQGSLSNQAAVPINNADTSNNLAYGSLNPDGSYSFGFKTNDQARQESADASNNAQGSYSYQNSSGSHDLSYVAGAATGFKPTGGNLSQPNGLSNSNNNFQGSVSNQAAAPSNPADVSNNLAYGSLNTDGSYSFGFKTNDQARQESADASNNVQGSYSYQNSAGSHDLSYVAGAATGFKPTGESLAQPNGLSNFNKNFQGSLPNQAAVPTNPADVSNNLAYGSLNPDGSYSFGFKTNDQARQESADASNNVQGSYSYQNSAGSHDLSYVAGAATGFKPTGGSLSQPNGLSNSNNNFQGSVSNQAAAPSNSADVSNNLAYGYLNPDGSYSFGFKTNDQARQESADASNNVQGSYSYQNSAGSHDLSYVSGAATGFKPTGGSLSQPNGLTNSNNNFQGSLSNQAAVPSNPADVSNNLAYGSLNPDGSYSFRFKTNDQSRQESADASNNVQGSYSYQNSAGSHDLSYVAGAATGFKPTGGGLSQPNGLSNSNNNFQGSVSNQAAVPSNPADVSNNLAYGSLNPDGSYSFGFKTNDQARQESADASNNVQGSYSYQNSAGSHDLSYVAGAATGFKPTGGSLSQPNGLSNSNNNFQGSVSNQAAAPSNPADVSNNLAYGSLNPDGSYSFGFKTNDQARQESADASNNVQGSYSYQNSAGSHDLSYVAGAATGFKPTGGSLSQPNGLTNSNNNFQGSLSNQAAVPSNPADVSNSLAYGSLNPDGSYSFGFKTNDQARQESADASNNVQGSYSYQNSAGSHDLSYVAGAATGFKPTGGSLSQPNGLSNSNSNFQGSVSNQAAAPSNPADVSNNFAYGSLNPDGSYSFGFKTNDQARQESADASNNVQGSYSYQNSAGSHDLSYVAGAATGFKPTGGSLSQPNGLSNSNNNFQGSVSNQAAAPSNSADVSNNLAYGYLNPDGSYSFGFKTNDQARQESADASNNVQGSYSYQNSAGSHDLSYVSGAATGFKPTGGSLSQPNGLTNSNNNFQGSLSNQAAVPSNPADVSNNLAYGSLNPDGSYSFGFKTNDQSRQESADASNNVQGSYSYQNSAGSHDLSYVAGAATGFKPTGGSLSQPNGLSNSNNNFQGSVSNQAAVPSNPADVSNNLAYGSLNPDGSYSFGFKTNDQARQESADASNNVQGSYSYQNSAGSHDLSYVAGAATGFKPTGGSLSQPNGLSNSNNNFQGSVSNQAAAPSNPADVSNNLAYGSLNPDGSYSFGFKTNDQARQESADASNNVQGSYSYQNSAGSHDLSYVAGAATGFKPTGGSLSQPNGLTNSNNNFQGSLSNQAAVPSNPADVSNSLAYGSLNPDGSYSFGFKTNDQARQESADASNNVQGSYSYQNSAGSHDLSYVAVAATGFKPTGGSLSQPNGLSNSNSNFQGSVSNQAAAPSNPADVSNNLAYGSLNPDGSYLFGFKTNDQARQESADASNNVQGSYSYQNSAGSHDLSYVAGAATGFKPTGGSLSQPNGLSNSNNNFQGSVSNQAAAPSNPADVSNNLAYGSLNPDGSYSFGFKTNDQARQESADASNNAQGSYSYQNSSGSHDLSYVAGAATGFKLTGGSLAQPNGLSNSNNNFQGSVSNQAAAPSNPAGVSNNLTYRSLNPDGSYSFEFKTNDQSRQESADASNNVQGSYSYQNSAGSHDLSYVAGAATGFKPSGGSLSQPNGLSNSNNNFQGSLSNQAAVPSTPADVSNNLAYGSLNPDGSYSFGFKTNDQARQESADASNNVQGSYFYQNSAGSHDLRYIAGGETGFKPTGGSLSIPNGLQKTKHRKSHY